jgi:hypothetical protein
VSALSSAITGEPMKNSANAIPAQTEATIKPPDRFELGNGEHATHDA